MPKHPGNQTSLFVYKDLSESFICPECGRQAKVVVPATTYTYLVHGPEDICVMDHLPPRGSNKLVIRG